MTELLNQMKALADLNRLMILELLQKHKCSVSILAEKLDISVSAVSQHLKILRNENIVTKKTDGHFCYYAVNKSTIRLISENVKNISKTKYEKNN